MLSVVDLRIDPFLKEVSLTLKRGESLAIIGRSGSGKTTLLRAIAGFARRISAGQISYSDMLWQDRDRVYVPASERSASLLFQESAIWPHLTVEQQLNLVGAEDQNLVVQLGLNSKTLGRALSGGERQRLALGRVLKAKAPILLLDEPFASLDATTKAQMISLLTDHQCVHSCAILIATHDAKDAQALGAPMLELL